VPDLPWLVAVPGTAPIDLARVFGGASQVGMGDIISPCFVGLILGIPSRCVSSSRAGVRRWSSGSSALLGALYTFDHGCRLGQFPALAHSRG